jgi:hypothetical protein
LRPGAATKFARFVCAFALFAVATALAQNPVPLVNQPLLPDAVAPGGSSFTLAVNGTGFISGAVVNWDDTVLVTTFVSESQLTATVPAPDIVTAGASLGPWLRLSCFFLHLVYP